MSSQMMKAYSNVAGNQVLVYGEAMGQVMRTIERVSCSDAAVLVTGESGVGKEVVARALHEHSPRRNGPWVDVNVAALPEHLVESELFGYEKGAFSGADSTKPGLFELANGGTLFLDEVGELDAKMQVKLLRVLDGVPYYRLGGVRKVSVDVRVVAATNANLEEDISKGRFRNDLFHRLAQVHVQVPPLRKRPEEILPFAQFFLRQRDQLLVFSADAQQALQKYAWPGNLRELKNVVTRCAILTDGGSIGIQDLPAAIARGATAPQPGVSYRLDSLEAQTIGEVLSVTGGHHKQAANLLGISPRTLSRKLKTYAAAC
jgi:DNA-binding NtrC family response regulator